MEIQTPEIQQLQEGKLWKDIEMLCGSLRAMPGLYESPALDLNQDDYLENVVLTHKVHIKQLKKLHSAICVKRFKNYLVLLMMQRNILFSI